MKVTDFLKVAEFTLPFWTAGALLICLKLVGKIDTSWWIVTLPFWLGLALGVFFSVVWATIISLSAERA